VRALFGALSWLSSNIPFAGSLTAGAIHGAERAISNALGTAISGIERRIAYQFHNLARIAGRVWHAIEGAAELIFALSVLAGAAVTIPLWQHLTRPLYRAIARAEHTAIRAIDHALAVAKAFTHSVAQGVYPRLNALEHELTRTIPREIRSARALAREAEDGVARLWKRVRTLEQTVSSGAIAAAVAAVLAAVGLDWIACNSRNNVNGQSGCSMWGEIEKVLGLAVLLTVAFDFPEFVQAAQVVADDIGSAVGSIEGTFGLSLSPLPPPAE